MPTTAALLAKEPASHQLSAHEHGLVESGSKACLWFFYLKDAQRERRLYLWSLCNPRTVSFYMMGLRHSSRACFFYQTELNNEDFTKEG